MQTVLTLHGVDRNNDEIPLAKAVWLNCESYREELQLLVVRKSWDAVCNRVLLEIKTIEKDAR